MVTGLHIMLSNSVCNQLVIKKSDSRFLVSNFVNHSQLITDRIGHVRCINILTWLRGFQVKFLYLVLFPLYLSLLWELRDKRNLKNLQF